MQLKDYFEDLNRNQKPIQWSYTKVKMLEKFDFQNKQKIAAYLLRSVLRTIIFFQGKVALVSRLRLHSNDIVLVISE